MKSVTLYGSPASLFTGRVRSYFIKAGIEYQEKPHRSTYFVEHVLTKAGGRHGMPTIELFDGTVIRDSVAIVDHFEQLGGYTYSPTTAKQRIVSRLLDTIGAEGLLRPAMHYRWNFDQDNKAFVETNFRIAFATESDPLAGIEAMRFVKENLNPAWGVKPEAHELIESLHIGMLQKLNAHFSNQPYFLAPILHQKEGKSFNFR